MTKPDFKNIKLDLQLRPGSEKTNQSARKTAEAISIKDQYEANDIKSFTDRWSQTLFLWNTYFDVFKKQV